MGFKRLVGLFAVLQIHELVNSWFRFSDVMNRLEENKISIPDEGDPSNITSSPAQESSKSDAESSIAMSSQLDF